MCATLVDIFYTLSKNVYCLHKIAWNSCLEYVKDNCKEDDSLEMEQLKQL